MSLGQPALPTPAGRAREAVSSSGAVKLRRRRLIVRGSDPGPQLEDVFLTVRDIEQRYGIGRTRAYQLVKEPWFPRPVVEGSYRWSLASLRAAEDAKAARELAGVPEPPQPKRRRRGTR